MAAFDIGIMVHVRRADVDGGDLFVVEHFFQVAACLRDSHGFGELFALVPGLLPTTAATSTFPKRRTFSVCTLPMKPVPTIAVLIFAIN